MTEDKTDKIQTIEKNNDQVILEKQSPRALKETWKDSVAIERCPSEEFLRCNLQLIWMNRFPTSTELATETPPILFKIDYNETVSYHLYGATKEGNKLTEFNVEGKKIVESHKLDKAFSNIEKIVISEGQYKELFVFIKNGKLHNSFIFNIAFKRHHDENARLDLDVVVAAKSIQFYMETHHPDSGFQFKAEDFSQIMIYASEDKDNILLKAIEYAKDSCKQIEATLLSIEYLKQKTHHFVCETLLRDVKRYPLEKRLIIYILLCMGGELGDSISEKLEFKNIHYAKSTLYSKLREDLQLLYKNEDSEGVKKTLEVLVEQFCSYLNLNNGCLSQISVEWQNILQKFISGKAEIVNISEETSKIAVTNTGNINANNMNTNNNAPLLQNKDYTDDILMTFENYKKTHLNFVKNAISSDDKKPLKNCEILLQQKIEMQEKYVIIHALLINEKIDKTLRKSVSKSMGFEDIEKAAQYFADDVMKRLSKLYENKGKYDDAVKVYKHIRAGILESMNKQIPESFNLGVFNKAIETLKALNSGVFNFDECKSEVVNKTKNDKSDIIDKKKHRSSSFSLSFGKK